MFRKSVHRSF